MDEGEKRVLQERNLDRLVANGAFIFTDTFKPYTSGEIGPYYVNAEKVMANGEDYAGAIDDMKEFISGTIPKDTIDVISGGEKRDWVFSFPVSKDWAKPHLMILKDRKVVGGTKVDGKYVVHIADLSNEGSSPRDKWIPTIRDQGGKIRHIFFYVDRLEEGVNVMKELGLESHAVVPLDSTAWDCLQRRAVVNEEIYKNLQERGFTQESRDAWAEAMLRTDAGLATLAELLEDNPEKGVKVVEVGYPQLKDELTFELHKQYNLNYNALAEAVKRTK